MVTIFFFFSFIYYFVLNWQEYSGKIKINSSLLLSLVNLLKTLLTSGTISIWIYISASLFRHLDTIVVRVRSHSHVVAGIVAKILRVTCKLTNTFRLIDFNIWAIVWGLFPLKSIQYFSQISNSTLSPSIFGNLHRKKFHFLLPPEIKETFFARTIHSPLYAFKENGWQRFFISLFRWSKRGLVPISTVFFLITIVLFCSNWSPGWQEIQNLLFGVTIELSI